MAKELVINQCLQGQLLGVTQDELVGVAEERARLISTDTVDLRAGQPHPFGDLDMPGKPVLTVEPLHQNEHSQLAQSRVQG